MAFPRSFKSETWFMRLPSGEIEVVTASALQDAFRCGLADARTPVRSVGSPIWSTLADVAGIDTSDPRDMGSLLPVALEEPADDLTRGAEWRFRTGATTPPLRSGGWRGAAGGLAVIVVVALTMVGGTRRSEQTSIHGAAAQTQQLIVAPSALRHAENGRDVYRSTKDDPHARTEALSLQRRLREHDAVRRAIELASPRRTTELKAKRSRTPVERPPTTPGPTPFSNGGSPSDPLNGAL